MYRLYARKRVVSGQKDVQGSSESVLQKVIKSGPNGWTFGDVRCNSRTKKVPGEDDNHLKAHLTTRCE